MTKLCAPEALLRRHRRMLRQEGVQAFLRKINDTVAVVQTNRPPVPGPKPRAKPEPKPGDPTEERAVRAVEVRKSPAPPFNSQILGAAQKFSKMLGPETMLVLERLYELGMRGNSSRGLTASYEGLKVDSSRTSYEHMAADDRDAFEIFQNAMLAMPPELRRYARELVLEDVGAEVNSARGAPPRRARSPKEVGMEISGYTDERRALGAAVATLKIIAWCVQKELGYTRRKK